MGLEKEGINALLDKLKSLADQALSAEEREALAAAHKSEDVQESVAAPHSYVLGELTSLLQSNMAQVVKPLEQSMQTLPNTLEQSVQQVGNVLESVKQQKEQEEGEVKE